MQKVVKTSTVKKFLRRSDKETFVFDCDQIRIYAKNQSSSATVAVNGKIIILSTFSNKEIVVDSNEANVEVLKGKVVVDSVHFFRKKMHSSLKLDGLKSKSSSGILVGFIV